ncbi:MAG: hypothetical protein ABSE07_05025 [Methanoregula sp.]
MRKCVHLNTGVPNGWLQDARGFRHNTSGIVPINGYIIFHGGDD